MCKKCKKDGQKGLKDIKEPEKVQPINDDCVINIEDDDEAADTGNTESTKSELGKLQFSVVFDIQKGQLVVCVIEAADLPLSEMLGTPDPFVVVYLLPDKKKKHNTKVHRKTLNPLFNETFIFKVSLNEVVSKSLMFVARDSRHDQIGHVEVPLDCVDAETLLIEWHDLAHPVDEEKKTKLGEINFSLRYLPTTGQLYVVINEARNLKKMDLIGLSDPYVKIWMMINGKKVKKKKTTIKKCTLNPSYQESFTFEVPSSQIQKVTLMIMVIDHDRIGDSDPIGRVIIGCESIGTELRMWNNMLANSRQPSITQWHNLQEVPKSYKYRK